MKLTRLFGIQKFFVHKPDRKRRLTSSPRPTRPFLLESLEPRLLLSGTPVPTTEMPATEPPATAAIVTTDKADYSPGETAVITTSNTEQEGAKFAEGEMVQFQVTRTDGVEDFPMGNLPWYVTDGVGGFDAYQEYDPITGQAVDRNADGQADWIRPDNDGTVNGSIQVPGNGQPIVLMPDRGTSGGYPKIATVISADFGRFAQTSAGRGFRFKAVSMAEAQAEAKRFAELLRSLPDRLRADGAEFNIEALADANVAGHAVSAVDAGTWHPFTSLESEQAP